MLLRQPYSRAGLTLLEVVLAMFIFLISTVAIWQLVTMGSERAFDIRQETRTSARCQSKLAEVVIGAVPLTSSGSYSNFDDDDRDMQWKLEVSESSAGNGLYNVKVSVKKDLGTGRFIESQLAQIIMDPAMRGTSLDRALPPPVPPTEPATMP